jgi:hypothetical protein
MSSRARTTLVPGSNDRVANPAYGSIAVATPGAAAPTRPYVRRVSGVLRSRPGLVLGPPVAPIVPARVTPAPSALVPSAPRAPVSRHSPFPRSTRDPWEAGVAAAALSEEQLQVMSSALHLTLGLLVERSPGDPALAEAMRAVTAVHVRNVVREAREHELRGRWLLASRTWMRAALAAGDDPWLFAHAARALLQSSASSQDAREVAGRALALDPGNPVARMVIERVGG